MAKVILISHTPEPEKVIASAAKLCYSSSDIENLMSGLTETKSCDFVEMLSSMGHESPIEHISFTFGIEDVSRAFTHQLVRHRIASYSQQSQRYVAEKAFEYVIPPEIAGIEQAKSEFLQAMNDAQVHYDTITKLLAQKHFNSLSAKGLPFDDAKKQAQKSAIEDARFVLPNACETKIIVTMNARSLLNFFAHRLCNRAQWEIREVAMEMYKQVCAVAPSVFKKAGPPCAFAACPEGKMSCGKSAKMKEIFAK